MKLPKPVPRCLYHREGKLTTLGKIKCRVINDRRRHHLITRLALRMSSSGGKHEWLTTPACDTDSKPNWKWCICSCLGRRTTEAQLQDDDLGGDAAFAMMVGAWSHSVESKSGVGLQSNSIRSLTWARGSRDSLGFADLPVVVEGTEKSGVSMDATVASRATSSWLDVSVQSVKHEPSS